MTPMFWTWFIFTIIVGACVGSFLNVVIFRLPEGRSVVHPPSHDPSTGRKLAWYENIPILSWIFLGGRDKVTRQPISIQYPLVEAVTAALFGLLFWVYYATTLRPEFEAAGLETSWPVFVVHLVLVACLVAATVIDARLYIIPLQIPWVATVVAVVGLPLAAWLMPLAPTGELVPAVGPAWTGAAFGATVGLGIALMLLQGGMLPRSFVELEEEITEPQPPDAFLDHPHPRREVAKEALFLLLPFLGAAVGYFAGPLLMGPSPFLATLGGVLCGYFVGALLVWGTRILGTLAFGKEAMGLGDVHLMGAIGAILGAMDSVFVFFIAPFMGLLAAAVLAAIAAAAGQKVRIIPYGPYLAGAAVVVMILREPIHAFLVP